MIDHPYRLPRHVVPRHYRLRLEPDLEGATFCGSETVTVDVLEETNRVVLNAADIRILDAEMVSDSVALAAEVEYDEDRQRAALTFSEELATGRWEFRCRFEGVLNDQLRGFYRSTFTDEEGETAVIATTQFEATEARRAFPCWDEPDFKASFGITLVVPPDLMAVSNSLEVARRSLDDGRTKVTFADTMVMSTYLVAFVVGPFEATDPVDVGGVPLRIVVPKGKLHLADFALDVSRFCLSYLADYYGIPYPGDKVDMVAIPDFAFGAMENLGCITYRESALLLNQATASSAEKMRVLDVIGHELAHMWFGDLVTMRWWDGLWLNEAFATFMEMKATDAFRPEWKRWLEFAAAERTWAFGIDELAGTRPVEFEVTSPEEAEAMFDGITYGKGSAVLWMVEQYVGEDTFRKGVEHYLRRHAYGNTETSDLWESLDRLSGREVGAVTDSWIHQAGFPQVTVRPTGTGVELEQGRFLLVPDSASGGSWTIPVRLRGIRAGEEFSMEVLLDGPTREVHLGEDVEWLVANAGGYGFYRTRYEEPLLSRLVDSCAHLDRVERFVLIDDSWAFVEAGLGSATEFLARVPSFRPGEDPALWGAVLNAVASVGHHLVTDRARPFFESWVSSVVSDTAERLAWSPAEGEPARIRRLRGRMIETMGAVANRPEVVEEARRICDLLGAEPASVDPDVGRAAIAVCAAHGDSETFATFLERHQSAGNPQDESRYLAALASFDRKESIEVLFGLILDQTVRSQDAAWVIARLLTNRINGPYAWEILADRWDDLLRLVPPMTRSRIADGFPALSQPEVARAVKEFLSTNPLRHAATAVGQKLERLSAKVEMRKRDTDSLSRWLSD